MPGQFINTGTNPGGKLSLVNNSNSGNLALGITNISFTATSGDITFNGNYYNNYSAQSSAGFVSDGGSIGNGISYNITGATFTQVGSIINTYSFLSTGDGYAWNVSWTFGGTGIVRMTLDSNFIVFAPIDTTYTNWQTTNIFNVPTLTGAFTFPATFTLYSPQTSLIVGGNNWC
jgi:hypothetical protein